MSGVPTHSRKAANATAIRPARAAQPLALGTVDELHRGVEVVVGAGGPARGEPVVGARHAGRGQSRRACRAVSSPRRAAGATACLERQLAARQAAYVLDRPVPAVLRAGQELRDRGEQEVAAPSAWSTQQQQAPRTWRARRTPARSGVRRAGRRPAARRARRAAAGRRDHLTIARSPTTTDSLVWSTVMARSPLTRPRRATRRRRRPVALQRRPSGSSRAATRCIRRTSAIPAGAPPRRRHRRRHGARRRPRPPSGRSSGRRRRPRRPRPSARRRGRAASSEPQRRRDVDRRAAVAARQHEAAGARATSRASSSRDVTRTRRPRRTRGRPAR